MKYNDQILENKGFNFFKQLMFNLGVLICIVLSGLLVLIYGFKFGVYEVLSDSQAPVFVKGDLVITKPQSEYEIGDIIKFDLADPVTHRVIAISEDGNIYYCHGDNVPSVDPSKEAKYPYPTWEEESAFLQGLIDRGVSLDNHNTQQGNYQAVRKNQVKGKVVLHVDGVGEFLGFVKEHMLLCVTLVVGVWCVCNVLGNELYYKRARRLM